MGLPVLKSMPSPTDIVPFESQIGVNTWTENGLGQVSFGPFSLDSDSMRVARDGSFLKLRPQAFLALKTLIKHNGLYVPYERLIHEAWGGNVVSRHTVATTIGAVRIALGEYGSWISYRPKLGYRLRVPGCDDLIRAGWHLWNRRTCESLEKALNHFERAAEEDGTDFRGFEGAANCYVMLGSYGMRPPREMYRRFLEAHSRAIALCGWTPELRSVHAYGLYMFERRFSEAESEFQRVKREKPNLVTTYVRLALLYTTLGRFDDALDAAAQGHRVDPLFASLSATEALTHFCRGDCEAAIATARRGLDLFPYLYLGRVYYAQALEHTGRVKEALREYRLARVIAPDIPWLATLEARCLALSGRREQAEEIMEELIETRLTEYIDAYFMAMLLDALGHRDDAIVEFERAIEENSATFYLVDVDPRLASLRTDPRFSRLRNKLCARTLSKHSASPKSSLKPEAREDPAWRPTTARHAPSTCHRSVP
jgi:tetratricopeptide (TPR) repeat protein